MFNEEKTKDLIEMIHENKKSMKRSAIDDLLAEGANIDGTHYDFPLFYAVYNNSYGTVKYLLEKGADVNKKSSRDNDNFTSFHLACMNGNTNIAELLIQYGANTSTKDIHGNTPLMIASLRDNDELVQTLLDTRTYTLSSKSRKPSPSQSQSLNRAMDLVYSTIDIENDSGYTPLNAACQNKNRVLIELFVSVGADISHAIDTGDKPIHQLTQENRPDLIDFLIGEGADVNDINTKTGETPLHCLTKYTDHESTLRLLLYHGADPTIPDKSGTLPIHHVARIGSVHNLLIIIENIREKLSEDLKENLTEDLKENLSEDLKENLTEDLKENLTEDFIKTYINARQKNGETPLFIACSNNRDLNDRERMIQVLIEKKADPNIRSLIDNSSPLDKLLESTNNPRLYELILNAGANPNHIRNTNTDAPIVRAIIRGKPEIVKMMIFHGADVNHVNTAGYTPLMIACGVYPQYPPSIRVIKTLLYLENINMNIRSRNGETAIEILRRVNPDMATHVDEDLSVYNTAMVSLMLDPKNPNPMFSQIDAEATENIKEFMFKRAGKKSKRRKSRKRQYTKRSRK
jgi:ankyrin repeat protein